MIASLLSLEKPEQLIIEGLRNYIIEHWEEKFEGVFADSKETEKKFFEHEKTSAMAGKEISRQRQDIRELQMMNATKAEVMTEVSKLAQLSEHRALDQYTKALPTMELFTKTVNDLRNKFFHLEELVKTKYQRIIEVDNLMKA